MPPSRPPHRPMGFSAPFTLEQFDELRDTFILCCVKDEKSDSGALFENYWPLIKLAALNCDQRLAIRATRKRERNPMRRLEAVARTGRVKQLLNKHPSDADALLYGAFRAGVAESHDELEGLSLDKLAAAVAAIKESGSILYSNTPPKRQMSPPVENYTRFLFQLYRKLTKRTPGVTYNYYTRQLSGRALRFFQAALCPVHPLSPNGIKKLFNRLKKSRRSQVRELEHLARGTVPPLLKRSVLKR